MPCSGQGPRVLFSMIGNQVRTNADGPEFSETGAHSSESFPISMKVPWLVTTKVTAPARSPFHIDRPDLADRIRRLSRPIVVLRAPGGFGKTTLLSEIYRREREHGNLAAWLSLDEEDTEEGVGFYLTYAFEHAGLDAFVTPASDQYLMELLALEIEKHGAPSLLVVDEVERLEHGALKALDFFLQRAPENLRILIGMRHNPGLDLSSAVQNSRCIVVGADQLRFSKFDIERYFGGALSRRELNLVVERTQGWPVTLAFYRTIRMGDRYTVAFNTLLDKISAKEGIALNWLGARLLRSFDSEVREYLFDLAQFDWIEPAIVDDVLSPSDTERRLVDFTAFQGLLQRLGTGENKWHLNPILKQLCNVERKRDDPGRFRQLHGVIAEVMLKHGHLISAVRHAGQAEDWEFVGKALVRAGGLRLWLREGKVRLGAIEQFITDEVTDSFPRLAMLRCRLLIHRSKLIEASALYHKARTRTDDFSKDRVDGDDLALRAEGMIVRTTLIGYGCLPYGDRLLQEVSESLEHVKDEQDPDPATVACLGALLYAAHHQRARFKGGIAFAEEAEAHYLLCNSQHGLIHVALHRGTAAMAQGRSDEAEEHYARAARIAEQHFPLDSAIAQVARILRAELDFERNRRESERELVIKIPVPFRNVAAWFDVYAAVNEFAADWRFNHGGIEDVLRFMANSIDWADSQGLVSVSRHLLALRVDYLAAVGRVEEMEAAWSNAAFPEDPRQMLDLDHQSWREMEAIAGARTRLLIASGRLDAAGQLIGQLSALARERGLLRTLMRCLALGMVQQHRSGNPDAATSHLVELLTLHARTAYARPMVREHRISRIYLDRLLAENVDPQVREAAVSLGEHLRSAEGPISLRFTHREREVLEWVGRGLRDKEVAHHLGLTVNGVRYHLRNIYRKTGASRRDEAVARARAARIID